MYNKPMAQLTKKQIKNYKQMARGRRLTQKSLIILKAIGLVVMLLSIALFIVMMVVTHRKKQGEKQGVVMPSKKTSKKIMKK